MACAEPHKLLGWVDGSVSPSLHGACVQMGLCKSKEELMMSMGSEAVIILLGMMGTCEESQSWRYGCVPVYLQKTHY